jgi:hypothetical protein
MGDFWVVDLGTFADFITKNQQERGLANRCLQPLGHLSALKSLGFLETFPNGGRNDSQMLLSTLGED